MKSIIQLFALLLCAHAFAETPIPRETREISGWQVHIQKKLLESEPADTANALGGLKKMLDEIVRDVPAPAVAKLRKVPLYFSPAYKPGQSGAEFHPGADHLDVPVLVVVAGDGKDGSARTEERVERLLQVIEFFRNLVRTHGRVIREQIAGDDEDISRLRLADGGDGTNAGAQVVRS